jgi:hypothetical protein
MSNPDKTPIWGLIIFGSLALAFVGLVISYKYTGDFTGLATLRTNRQTAPLVRG